MEFVFLLQRENERRRLTMSIARLCNDDCSAAFPDTSGPLNTAGALGTLLCFTKAVNLRSTNSFCLSKYHKGSRNISGGVCSASARYKSDGRFLRLKKTQARCLLLIHDARGASVSPLREEPVTRVTSPSL